MPQSQDVDIGFNLPGVGRERGARDHGAVVTCSWEPGHERAAGPYVQSELDEYIHVPSPNWRIALAFGSISTQGKIAGGALTYAQRTRMYYRSEVANTPKHRFIDPINERYATSPLHDGRRFKNVIDILEPTGAGDEATTGMRTALGIQ